MPCPLLTNKQVLSIFNSIVTKLDGKILTEYDVNNREQYRQSIKDNDTLNNAYYDAYGYFVKFDGNLDRILVEIDNRNKLPEDIVKPTVTQQWDDLIKNLNKEKNKDDESIEVHTFAPDDLRDSYPGLSIEEVPIKTAKYRRFIVNNPNVKKDIKIEPQRDLKNILFQLNIPTTDFDATVKNREIKDDYGINSDLYVGDQTSGYSEDPAVRQYIDRIDKMFQYRELNEEEINKVMDDTYGKVGTYIGNSKQAKRLDPRVTAKLRSFLDKLGVKVQVYDSLINRFDGDVLAAVDTVKKVIYLTKDESIIEQLGEEASHMILESLPKEHPYYSRILSLMGENNHYITVLGDNFDQYNKKYNGDIDKLKLEAAGKLLYDEFLKGDNSFKDEGNAITRTLKNILEWFKSLFRKTSITQLASELGSIYQDISGKVLNNEMDFFTSIDEMNQTNLKDPVFYALKKDISAIEKSLKEHLENRIVRLEEKIQYYSKIRNVSPERIEEVSEHLENLKQQYNKGLYGNGTLKGVSQLLKDLTGKYGLVERLNKAINDFREDPQNLNLRNNLANTLVQVSRFIEFDESVINDIKTDLMAYISSLEKAGGASYSKMINKVFDNLSAVISKLKDVAYVEGVSLMEDVLKPFFPEGTDVYKLLKTTQRDLNWFETMLLPMAEVNDSLLQAKDMFTRNTHVQGFQEGLEVAQEILGELDKYQKVSGSTATDWILEQDENKTPTGMINTMHHMDKFRNDERKNKLKLMQKYAPEEYKKYEKDLVDPVYEIRANADKAIIESIEKNKKEKEFYAELNEFEKNTRTIISGLNTRYQPKNDTEKKIKAIADDIMYKLYGMYQEISSKEIAEMDIKDINEKFIVDVLAREGIYGVQLIVYKSTHPEYSRVYMPSDKYINKAYANMTESQKALYNHLLQTKYIYEKECLPPKMRNLYRAPQIEASATDKMVNMGAFTAAKLGVKQSFTWLDYEKEQQGLAGNMKYVPVQGVYKLDNPGKLTRDFAGAMILYTQSCIRHRKISDILDYALIFKDVLGERKLEKVTKSKTTGAEKRRLEKKGKETNAYKRFLSYMDMNYFGITKKMGKFDKFVDKFNSYTAMQTLGVNISAGINNIFYASMNTAIEASAGIYYNHKDYAKATSKLASWIPKALADYSSIKPTSKAILWHRTFMSNRLNENPYRTEGLHRSTIGRTANEMSIYAQMHMGEFWNQNVVSLSMGEHVKLFDKNNKEISLVDAMIVKDGKLVLDEGVKKLDGSEFTKDDMTRFIESVKRVNDKLQGIYDTFDAAPVQVYSWVQSIMMFRKFIIPGILSRYRGMGKKRGEGVHFDYRTQQYEIGYYTTMVQLIRPAIRTLMAGQWNMIKNWDKLKDYEKANVLRFSAEALLAFGFYLLINSALGGGDDEDEWAENMLALQINRTYSQLMFYANPEEFLRLVKSPAACVNQIETVINLIKDVPPWSDAWSKEVERGKYKGFTKIERDFSKFIPLYGSVINILNPEDQLTFYKN